MIFIILNGVYEVSSMQFNRAARVKQEKEEKSPIVRTLAAGNYFGEVSCILDCNRSATVTSLNFGTYGTIDKATVDELFSTYPTVKKSMWAQIMTTYDDDLKIFLTESLSHIDYLSEIAVVEPEALIHLAFCMEA